MRNGTGLRLGFVILVWNSEKVIGPCLESIFAMKGIESHVVVVDNGSTDDTLARVNAAWAKFAGDPGGSTLEVIRLPENLGMTVSRNKGLRALTGIDIDYYCNLDSDTVVNEAAMLGLARTLKAHPCYGVVGPRMTTSSGVEQMSARAFPTVLEKLFKGSPIPTLNRVGTDMERQSPVDPAADCYPVDYLMGACLMIRPEAMAAVGGMDERIFYGPDDADFCLCVWEAGYQVAYCPEYTIIHEWQRLSKKKLFSKMNWEHVKGLAYMFAKHRYLFGTRRLKRRFPGTAEY